MEYKVYKSKFWRDKIWIALIPGIFGLLMFLFGAAMTGASIYQWLNGEVSFWVFIGVLLMFDLPCLFMGGIAFYILLAAIKTKIIITDEFLILDAPLYKKRVFIQDIRGITKTPSNINLFYEKEGKIKVLQLTGWACRYFPEIAGELRKVNPKIVEYKIYKSKFWRDKIWIALILGIFGLLMFLFGAAMTGESIYQWLNGEIYQWVNGEVSFWAFIGVLLMFDLPCLFTGGIAFYILLAAIKTKIIITDEFLICDAPLYKKRIFIQDIRGIVFNKTPSYATSCINLFYEKKGKIKMLQLTGWTCRYFPEIAGELRKVNPNIQMEVRKRG